MYAAYGGDASPVGHQRSLESTDLSPADVGQLAVTQRGEDVDAEPRFVDLARLRTKMGARGHEVFGECPERDLAP